MVVRYNRVNYLVVMLYLYTKKVNNESSEILAFNLETKRDEWVNLSEVTIIDGRIPEGLCINRRKKVDGSELIIVGPNLFHLTQDFWERIDDGDEDVWAMYEKYRDDLKKFHGIDDNKNDNSFDS